MTNKRHNHIAAIILSGGSGSRMGGVDKGLQKYKGEALISWVIQSVSPQVGKTLLSINRNHNDYDKFALETVTDGSSSTVETTYNGPIAGIIYSAKKLNSKDYQSVLIASCDSPKLTNDYVSKLNTSLVESNAQVAVVNDGIRNQNLHCLIKLSAIDSLTKYYQNNGRSMYGWFQAINLIEVDFSNKKDSFVNFNTLQDLQN